VFLYKKALRNFRSQQIQLQKISAKWIRIKEYSTSVEIFYSIAAVNCKIISFEQTYLNSSVYLLRTLSSSEEQLSINTLSVKKCLKTLTASYGDHELVDSGHSSSKSYISWLCKNSSCCKTNNILIHELKKC
jgi:hypothetical protein